MADDTITQLIKELRDLINQSLIAELSLRTERDILELLKRYENEHALKVEKEAYGYGG